MSTERKDTARDITGMHVLHQASLRHSLMPKAPYAETCAVVEDGDYILHEKPTASSSMRPITADPLLDASRITDVDIEAEAETTTPEQWKPQKRELYIMISLSFISFMVSLDATVLVTVLPVSLPFNQHHDTVTDTLLDRRSPISLMELL